MDAGRRWTGTADDSRRPDILAYFSEELTPFTERLGATAP
jgi:hypothetical protein